MSKILYIAPFKDFSGYATAARGYLKALHLAGADIVARAVKYDMADPGTAYKSTELETQLLRKSLDGVDIVVQHTTPNEMRPVKSGAKNVAVVAWETSRIPQYWVDKLNQFDIVITFCEATIKAFRDSGVTTKLFRVPHCFDMSTYSLEGVKPLEIVNNDLLQNRHIFYNISQLTQKKGLDVLLKAYFTEFSQDPDKVLLVLKTYLSMANRQDENNKIAGFVNHIKGGLKLAKYPQVVIMTQTLKDEQVRRLHATGDTYICSSRGEGWNIPAFEALAYGNKLVTTIWGGMDEFIHDHPYKGKGWYNNVIPVNGVMEPVFGQGHADPELYTANENWFEPSINSMRSAMREAVDAEPLPKSNLSHFDHSVVGPDMLRIINGQ